MDFDRGVVRKFSNSSSFQEGSAFLLRICYYKMVCKQPYVINRLMNISSYFSKENI